MRRFYKFIALTLLLVGLRGNAQPTEALIVTSGGVQSFVALSNVTELTFSDNGLTIVQTDNTVLEFNNDWLVQFGQTDGIRLVSSDSRHAVQVFDAKGVLVTESASSDYIDVARLPHGVYIIKCDGRTIKIQR